MEGAAPKDVLIWMLNKKTLWSLVTLELSLCCENCLKSWQLWREKKEEPKVEVKEEEPKAEVKEEEPKTEVKLEEKKESTENMNTNTTEVPITTDSSEKPAQDA